MAPAHGESVPIFGYRTSGDTNEDGFVELTFAMRAPVTAYRTPKLAELTIGRLLREVGAG